MTHTSDQWNPSGMTVVQAANPADVECGRALLAAFASRDWAALERTFAPDARLRAVIPNSERPFRDRVGAADAAAQIKAWFQDADVFEILDANVVPLADRVHVSYRVRVHEPDGWSLVEQQLYLTPGPEGIRFCNLVCSGFRPTEAPHALQPGDVAP